MTENTIAAAANKIAAADPSEGDPELPSLFDLALPKGAVRKSERKSRMARKVATIEAAYVRLAERIFTEANEEGVTGFDIYKSGEGLEIPINEHWSEDMYQNVRVAMRDWLVTHGQVEAKGQNAAKGSFRFSGSFHATYQRGEHVGEACPYPEMIRVTRVK